MPAGLTSTDSMFSVRETPWHGLGAVLADYPTSIEEALAKSGLGWGVEQNDLYIARPPFDSATPSLAPGGSPDQLYVPALESRLVKASGFKANVRKDNGTLLGVVSDDYTVVSNEDAFRFLDSLIASDLHFETAGSIRGGRRVWVLARRPEFVEVAGDQTATFIYVANSHDGSMAVTAAVTPVRIVCQNTLGLALKGSANRSYKFRHVGELQEKFDEARKVLELTINYEAMFKAEAEKLALQPMGTSAFISKVVNPLVGLDAPEKLTDRARKNRETMRDQMTRIFLGNGPAGDTRGNSPYSAWCGVNAVGEFSDWHRRYTKSTNQVARSFEDQDLKQKALVLAKAAA